MRPDGRCCPLCDGALETVECALPFSRIVGHVDDSANEVIAVHIPDGYRPVRCASCKVVFVEETPLAHVV